MKIEEFKDELIKRFGNSAYNLPKNNQKEFLRIVWELKSYATNRSGLNSCKLSCFDLSFLKTGCVDFMHSLFSKKKYLVVDEIKVEEFNKVLMFFDRNKNALIHSYMDLKVLFAKFINSILNSIAHNQCFFVENRFFFWNIGSGKVMLVGTLKRNDLKKLLEFLETNHGKYSNKNLP